MALTWAWLSDGLCRGARWPFVYIGAVITVILRLSQLWKFYAYFLAPNCPDCDMCAVEADAII
jgi:D-alanyl-lipoteichoic acid acyltransferase DltB (MBOAT superfamily)